MWSAGFDHRGLKCLFVHQVVTISDQNPKNEWWLR